MRTLVLLELPLDTASIKLGFLFAPGLITATLERTRLHNKLRVYFFLFLFFSFFLKSDLTIVSNLYFFMFNPLQFFYKTEEMRTQNTYRVLSNYTGDTV